MRSPRSTSRREPTIALINIVFLMLVFFMVAGTLSQPLDASLKLVNTADLEGRPPPDGLVLHADGRLSHRGRDVASAEAYMATRGDAERDSVRLVPDRDLPAAQLVALANDLRAAGVKRVLVVTERQVK